MKRLSIVLIVFAFVLSCATVAPYINQRPQASIERFDIAAISFKDIDLLFDIAITNPYPIAIKLDKIKARFDIEGKKFFETATVKGLNVKAMGKEHTQFTVNLEYSKIEGIVRDYMNKDSLRCDVVGEMSINLPKHNIPNVPRQLTFPFKLSRNIPAIKPTISIANFKVQAPSAADIERAIRDSGKKALSPEKIGGFFKSLAAGRPAEAVDVSDLDLKINVTFDLNVKNRTKAKLQFNSLAYDFSMNDVNVFNGSTTETKMAGDTLVLKVANQMSSRSLGKGVMRFFRERTGNFRIKGETRVQMPESIRKEPLKLQFDERGGFNF